MILLITHVMLLHLRLAPSPSSLHLLLLQLLTHTPYSSPCSCSFAFVLLTLTPASPPLLSTPASAPSIYSTLKKQLLKNMYIKSSTFLRNQDNLENINRWKKYFRKCQNRKKKKKIFKNPTHGKQLNLSMCGDNSSLKN